MSRAAFFAQIARAPIPNLTAPAKASINIVLDEWEARADCTDLRWLAYMLATMLGEVGTKMSTVREGFSRSDAAARAFVRRQGYRYANEVNGHVYYGRGLVQLTWDFNYKSMGKIIGVDLYNNPDYALETENAVKIMFEGMIRGTFTGKKLSHYFNAKTEDWVNARRIINGTDKAALFAQYGRQFYVAAKLLKFEHKAAPKPPLQTTPKQEAIAATTPATAGVAAEATARSLETKVDVAPDQVTSTLDGLQTQFQSAAATGLRIFAIACAAVTVVLAIYMAWKYAKVLWSWWKGEQ